MTIIQLALVAATVLGILVVALSAVALTREQASDVGDLVPGFSKASVACVITLAVSGALQAALRAGGAWPIGWKPENCSAGVPRSTSFMNDCQICPGSIRPKIARPDEFRIGELSSVPTQTAVDTDGV